MTLNALGPLISLFLIVSVLLIVLWKVRRIGNLRLGSGCGDWTPRVLARTPVGPRQGVALIRIGERVLAISLGDGGVRTLLELSTEESAKIIQQAADSGMKNFKETFEAALKKFNERANK